MLSGPSCSNLIGVLVTNLLNEQSSLQPELAAHRLELSKTSGLLNAVRTHTRTKPTPRNSSFPVDFTSVFVSPPLSQDLRALVLLLSVQPPQAVDPALCPALQELLGRCRVCVQQRSALELEAKDHKAKGTTQTISIRTETVSDSFRLVFQAAKILSLIPFFHLRPTVEKNLAPNDSVCHCFSTHQSHITQICGSHVRVAGHMIPL